MARYRIHGLEKVSFRYILSSFLFFNSLLLQICRYFTWDQHKFANSLDMIKNLTAKGRHLTLIIDPHIKRDNNYFFHNDCTDRGYYVKNKDGKDYEGWCWPGSSR